MAGSICRTCTAVALACLVSAPAMAQVSRVAANETIADRPRGEPMVTVNADQVPLRTVVDLIARQAGWSAVYSKALMPEHILVTLHVSEVPAREAMMRALHGTGVSVAFAPAGYAVFVRENAVQGSVSGKITNSKTNVPVAGATVLVDDATRGAISDADGVFRLTVPVGEHRISVRAVGFVRQARRVVIDESKTMSLNFALESSTSVLDEVVVTGSVVATERRAIATPITVITAEDIEKRGITRIDQLFRGEVPGVMVLDDGVNANYQFMGMAQSKITSRGTAGFNGQSNPLKTYVDGVEVVDPQMLGTIDPRTVERIEIITGPQAATVYGSGAMGGVMMIFTKRGNGRSAPDFTWNMRYGAMQSSLNTSRTPKHDHALNMAGGSGTEFNYSGTLTYGYSGQWQPKLYNRIVGVGIGVTHKRGPVTLNGTINGTGAQNGIMSLSWQGVVGQQRAARGDDEVKWNATARTNQVNNTSALTLGLNADYQPFSWWRHSATVGRSMNKFALVPNAPKFIFPSDTLYTSITQDGQRMNLGYNMQFAPWAYHWFSATFTAGATGSWGTGTRINGKAATKKGALTSADVYQTLDDQQWGMFATARLAIFDQISVPLGIRFERNPAYGTSHKIDATPTTGLAYAFDIRDVTLKLMASYGRATRAPINGLRDDVLATSPGWDPQTWLTQIANPGLRPEYSRGPQGGFELYWGNRGSLTLTHYKNTVDDLIESVQVDSIEAVWVETGDRTFFGIFQSQNVASIRQIGWEGTGAINLGPFGLRGAYSWNSSRVLKNNWGPEWYDREIVNAPTHNGNFTVSYARGGTSLNVSTNWMGTRIANNGRNDMGMVQSYMYSTRLKMYYPRAATMRTVPYFLGYAKTDLNASHRLTRSLSATLNVANVGNSFTSDAGRESPTLGRITTLGFSLRWPNR